MMQFIKRFIFVYFLMLGVILTAFSVIYSRSADIVEYSLVNNRLANLQQIRTNVDNNLSSVIDSVNHVSSNWQIRSFANINEPHDGPNIIRLMETIRALHEFNVANPVLRGIFVVYDSNDVVITPTAAWQFSRFSTQYMTIDGMCPDEWRRLIFYSNVYPRFIPALTIHMGDFSTFEAIQYITPIRTIHGNTGAIIAHIDNRAVENMFNVLHTDLGETALIINTAGEVITALAGTRDIPDLPLPSQLGEGIVRFEREGIHYLMSYTSSHITDWIYISIIRSDYALAQLNAFRGTVFMVLSVMTVITLAIAIAYSVLQSRPIKVLQDTITAQMPLLQHSYLRDLFDGKMLNTEDTAAGTLGFDLTGSRYIAVLVTGKEAAMNLEQLAKVQMFADRYAPTKSGIHVKHHCLNQGGNEMAMLFIDGIALFSSESIHSIEECTALDEHVHRFADSLAEELITDGIPGIVIGIGCAYDSLANVQKSYTEAADAIRYFNVLGASRTICHFSEVPTSKEFYWYPDDEEKRLLNMIRSGDDKGVHSALTTILNENFVGRELSGNMIAAFVNHLCLGLFKIGQVSLADEKLAERVSDFYNSYNQLADLDKMTSCTQLYVDISKSIYNEKQNKMQNIVADMKKICESDYQNPNLCLTDLSIRYNLSEAYLSQQFKEQTRENFHGYLQDLRINNAIKLLTTTGKSIREIGEAVGYTSYNTFSKAFKRKTGINAGDYRRHLEG